MSTITRTMALPLLPIQLSSTVPNVDVVFVGTAHLVPLARRAAADEAVALAHVPALPFLAVIPDARVGARAARRRLEALVLHRWVGLATEYNYINIGKR